MFLSLKCKYCHQWKREISCITSCLCLTLMKFLIWYVYRRDSKQLFNVSNLVYVGSGDVLVVYCKDKESQDLPPENLYNSRLHSIERHPVLSELKNKNRVLSINDKFHPHQVEHLKNCCQQLWRRYIFVFDTFMIFEQFYLDFCLISSGVFCIYGFPFRDFGFCIVGCTVCLATIRVIMWSKSTRQPIEFCPNSLYSAILSMIRLLKLWLLNGFIAVVSCLSAVCVCPSVWII